MLARGRDGEVRAAPVAAVARDAGDVPLAGAAVTGLPLDVADHPRRAGDGGERAVCEPLVPGGVELLQRRRLVQGDGLHGHVPGVLHGRVGLVDGVPGRVVVLGRRLADDGVVHAGCAVHERRLRRRVLHVLLADIEVPLPRRPLLADRLGVGGQAGLLEEVGAVADGERPGVRPEADRGSVGGRRRLPLPREERRLQAAGAHVVQVDELVRLGLHHLGDTPDLDPLDVVEPATGRKMGLEGLVVLLLLLDARLLDRHIRVELHVLVVEAGFLVAERPEEPDGEGDLLVGRGPTTAA